MKKFKLILALVLVSCILISNTLAIGAEMRQLSVTSDTTVSEFVDGLNWLDPSKNNSQSKKFLDIIDIIEQTYYYGVTNEQLFSYVTNGSILRLPQNNIGHIYNVVFQHLDSFSHYVPPLFTSVFEDPHYTGFGIVIRDSKHDKYSAVKDGLIIEEVYADSPAAKAGIKPNDKLVAVGDIYLENLSLAAVTTILSNYGNNDDCKITVLRGQKQIEFVLRRSTIPSSELMTYFYPDYSAAVFQITGFQSSTLEGLFDTALKQTVAMGYKNLIIDLRNNPGGVVDYAMKTTDKLITQEHTLFTFFAKGEVMFMEYFSDSDGYTFDNIYILVNQDTASAAEAMTISLKSLSDATIVGTKTYGKQIGQIIHTLADNSSISVTAIKGYGPNNEDYNTIGIVPDYTVENKTVLFSLPDDYLPLSSQQLSLIHEDGDADAIKALEQRFAAINFLPEKYVDGVYDQNLDACIKIIQIVKGHEYGIILDDILVYLDKKIESYKGQLIQDGDTQLDFVIDLIKKKDKTR